MNDMINRVAARVIPSAIDGMRKQQAIKYVNNKIIPNHGGFFTDEYWRPVQDIWKAFDKASINYSIDSSEYGVSPSFQQVFPGEKWRIPNDYKEWKFSIRFPDNKGKEQKIYGTIVASGAGSIEDPLEKYDVVGYVS